MLLLMFIMLSIIMYNTIVDDNDNNDNHDHDHGNNALRLGPFSKPAFGNRSTGGSNN